MAVRAYDSTEETTSIELACLLESSCVKRWLVVPVFSLLTIFIFPIVLYWRPRLQRIWLFSEARSFDQATHIYLESIDKNKEIVRLNMKN